MFRHYLVETAGLVNLTQDRRLEVDEQFAFTNQIEFCNTLGTRGRDEAPSGILLTQKITSRIVSHAIVADFV